MSYHRHHPAYSRRSHDWDTYISSRPESLLGRSTGSSGKKRYTMDQHTGEPRSKRSRTYEDRLSSVRKDLLPTLTLATTSTQTVSTLNSATSRSRHTANSWKSSLSLIPLEKDTKKSIDAYLKRTEYLAQKSAETKATSLYQQQQCDDSDESIESFIERIEHKSSSISKPNNDTSYRPQLQEDFDESIDSFVDRTEHKSPGQRQHKDGKWKPICSLDKQRQRDPEYSIDTFNEHKQHKSPTRFKRKNDEKKAASYQQQERTESPARTKVPASSSVLSTSSSITTTSHISDNAKSLSGTKDEDNYIDLFGKRLSIRSKRSSRSNKRLQALGDDKLAIDMQDVLEAISTDPLPKGDPKTEKKELDFFFGNEGTLKNNKEIAKYTAINGFTGFSDDGDDGSEDD